MSIPLEFFILVSGVAGAAIGTLGMHLYCRAALKGKERETWRKAERFFRELAAIQNANR